MAILLLAPLLLGGLAVIVTLLVFPKTRVLGIVLLCLGGLVGMAMFWALVSYRVVSTHARESATVIDGHVVIQPTWRSNPASVPQPVDTRAAAESRTEYLKQHSEIQDYYVRLQADREAKIAAAKAAAAANRDKAAAARAAAAANREKATKKAEAVPSATVVAPAVKMFEAAARALSKALTAKAEEKPSPVAAKADPKPSAESPPEWINLPPRTEGDVYLMSIVVGPWKTRQECEAELPNELQKALDHYVETCLGQSARVKIVLPSEYLRQRLVKGQYEKVVQTSYGPMKQLHVLLAFDADVKSRVEEEYHRATVMGRFWQVGIVLAAVLWPLAVAYAYLKTDLSTGGAYRGRLRLAAILAILGPVAALLAVVA
jgi:hypothetical protein